MSLGKLEKSMTHFKWFFFRKQHVCKYLGQTGKLTLCENKYRARGSDVKILLIKKQVGIISGDPICGEEGEDQKKSVNWKTSFSAHLVLYFFKVLE